MDDKESTIFHRNPTEKEVAKKEIIHDRIGNKNGEEEGSQGR